MNIYHNQLERKSYNVLRDETLGEASKEKSSQTFITIACLIFFPAIYFIGKWMMLYLAG